MTTTEETSIPAAPAHLSKEAQAKWTETYKAAFETAARDAPGNERAQRTAALKAANAIQAVKPPMSIVEVDALEAWQFIRRETKEVKGVLSRICVTIDGRKYIFPVAAPKAEPANSGNAKGKKGDD